MLAPISAIGAVLAVLAMIGLVIAVARHQFRAADAAASLWLTGLVLSLLSFSGNARELFVAIGAGLLGAVVIWFLPTVRRPRYHRASHGQGGEHGPALRTVSSEKV